MAARRLTVTCRREIPIPPQLRLAAALAAADRNRYRGQPERGQPAVGATASGRFAEQSIFRNTRQLDRARSPLELRSAPLHIDMPVQVRAQTVSSPVVQLDRKKPQGPPSHATAGGYVSDAARGVRSALGVFRGVGQINPPTSSSPVSNAPTQLVPAPQDRPAFNLRQLAPSQLVPTTSTDQQQAPVAPRQGFDRSPPNGVTSTPTMPGPQRWHRTSCLRPQRRNRAAMGLI